MDKSKGYKVLEDVRPGPSSIEVIVDNKFHVSEDVWEGKQRNVLDCSCGSKMLRSWEITEEMEEILEECGFGVFRDVSVVIQNDAALVTALVERWRRETNTFFMRPGEMTVTLQDVGYILGLPLFGEPVTCGHVPNPEHYFHTNWLEPLTTEQWKGSTKRNQIITVWLHKWYARAPTPDRALIHTKAYILFICGTVLFPTSSRNVVHPRYLKLLNSDTHIHEYAWGATQEEGPKIAEADYIFFPCLVNGNHWVLFVFSVKEWVVLLLDSLHDDRKNSPLRESYAIEFTIMEQLIPFMLRTIYINGNYPEGNAVCQVMRKRPKQHNLNDCGVYVMKYMDFLLQGYNISSFKWSEVEADNFRYRIAWELQKGKARDISDAQMMERLRT